MIEMTEPTLKKTKKTGQARGNETNICPCIPLQKGKMIKSGGFKRKVILREITYEEQSYLSGSRNALAEFGVST